MEWNGNGVGQLCTSMVEAVTWAGFERVDVYKDRQLLELLLDEEKDFEHSDAVLM